MGQKILVVEPDVLLLQTIAEKMLLPCGYTVLTAQDQEKGLTLALSELPDVLLLHLPLESSAKLLSNLANTLRIIPTILIVEKESAQIEVRFLRLGVVDYIALPLLPGIVQDSVGKVLDKSANTGESDKLVNDLDRINKELEQYLYENNRLLKIGQSINSVLDFNALLTRVTEAAVFITEAEEGYLILLDKQNGSLRMRAKQNSGQKKAHCLNNMLINDDIAATVIQSGKTVLLQDTNSNLNNTAPAPRFYSLLNVPLKIKDRIVGILGVKNYSETKTFSSSHLYQLSQLSNIAATALENAQKYDHACKELAHYTHKFSAQGKIQ